MAGAHLAAVVGAPVQRVGVVVEVVAERLRDHQQEDHGQRHGDPQAGEHPGEHALEVAGPADLAVQRGAPVRPEEIEHHHRDQQHARAQRAEAEDGRHVAGLRGPGVGLRVGVADPEDLVRLLVERADKRRVAVDQQQYHNDREADQAPVEAPLLDPGVSRHAERHQQAGQRDGDDRHHEYPGMRGKPGGAAGIAECRPQRLEQLDGQDVAVDRRPQPQDEPPAGGRHHEAEAAAQDPALPDVIPAGPRNSDDQPGIGDHQEGDPHPGDQDRGEQLPLRNEGLEREFVDAEGDDVGGQAGIDHRVPD